jgi:hypothetical protein
MGARTCSTLGQPAAQVKLTHPTHGEAMLYIPPKTGKIESTRSGQLVTSGCEVKIRSDQDLVFVLVPKGAL